MKQEVIHIEYDSIGPLRKPIRYLPAGNLATIDRELALCFFAGREHLEDLLASKLFRLLCEIVVGGLVVDKHFMIENPLGVPLKGGFRDHGKAVVTRTPYQRGTTTLAKNALRPVGRNENPHLVEVFELEIFTINSKKRSGRPTATHGTVTYPDLVVLRRGRKGHPTT